MSGNVKNIIAQTFLDMAQILETGETGRRPKIALTALGSEHGEENAMYGALLAQAKGVDVVYIGTKQDGRLNYVNASCEAEAHETMENLLASGEVDGAVTMHYPFPIGVSTVGRVITPARGKAMYIATTTGTSSTNRVEGMIKNTIYGIITAKACGVKNPTIGIANIDGARQVEAGLKKLQENGYSITFASSERVDGGCVMRGNDILTGAADIMVTDSLTGNLIIKMLSAFNSGGSYESLGWGYGPGIGEGYDRLVLIVSRASGAAVVGCALEYGAELVKGDYRKVAAAEFAAANKAGLKGIINALLPVACSEVTKEVAMPPKEVVTATISGIEIMDLEEAVHVLWANGIYAESGMGCTGPIILVSEGNAEKALAFLKKAGFLS
jgi:hypothetical protein